MYAHVSREEWLFRGLAIVTILALVGIAVFPPIENLQIAWYLTEKYGGAGAAAGGIVA